MRKNFANILIMVVATVVGLAMAEIGLRLFTQFPIHGDHANRIFDADYGYRLDPRHPESDNNGFRNDKDKEPEVAAIGDSHTYGSGVASRESWPSQFERIVGKSTTNFGIGSYGSYSYYALAKRALERNFKHIIIAVYIRNDFASYGSTCWINFEKSKLWREAKEALSIAGPGCTFELKRTQVYLRQILPPFLTRFFSRSNLALLSAIDYLVMSPIDDLYHAVFRSPTRQQTSAVRTRGGISQTNGRPASEVPIGSARPASFYFASHRLKNIRAVSYMSDLGFPDTRRIYEDFEKLMQDLKSDAFKRGATLGVLIIPSKVQIIYAHTTNKNLFESEPWMAKLVRDQNKLQKRMTDFFDEQNMKWRSSLPELLDALRRADKEGKLVFPATSSHPNAIGYKAYAIAAAKLFYDMQGD